MDTITHGMVGALVAQLGFRRRIGRDASWVAALAAVTPDLDMLVTPFLSLTGAETDQFTSVVIHRGISHSLLMVPLLSIPIALIWWWFRSRAHRRRGANPSGNKAPPSFRILYACVFAGLLTGPLLDWCTSYGTQLLAPLTDARYALDAIPILDIIFTPVVFLTLLVCYVLRKLAPSRAARSTLVIAWVGFALVVAYVAAGRAMHDWAVAKARLAAGVDRGDIVRSDAYPGLGTIFLWRTVVETRDKWIATRVHHFSTASPETWRTQTAQKTDGPWIRKARGLPQVKTYEWFSGSRLRAEHTEQDGLHAVTFHDMRYGTPQESVRSLWPLTVIFDGEGKILHVGREHGPGGRDFRKLLGQIWSDIWNP